MNTLLTLAATRPHPVLAFLCLVIIPVLVIGLIIYGVSQLLKEGATTGSASNALSILEERLAKGEIDADTFAASRAVLLSEHDSGASTPPPPPAAPTEKIPVVPPVVTESTDTPS